MTTAVSDRPTAAAPRTSPRMLRLAYLTNQYPKNSHTFIRRELKEMERRGHSLLRLSIRPADAPPVDPDDVDEAARTLQCLSQPAHRLLAAVLAAMVRRPAGLLRAFATMWGLARRSGTGLVRHLAYLVEACALLRVVERRRIQHVHVHFGTNPASVALLMRRLGGPPYSITIHGPEEFDAPVALSLAEKVGSAEFVVAISSFGASQVRRWIPYSQWAKVHVVGCTVGPSFFDAARPIRPDSRMFVCIGRFNAQKGHLLLIDAFADLVRLGADARLVLAGDGELRGQIEARIVAAGLKDRVQITGWVDEGEVRRLILDARAVVLSSFAEGLPMVIMEAFALGRPVIATSIAGIPELVKPGVSGWLTIAGDSGSLVRAMREALAAPASHLEQLAAAGRDLVLHDHSTATETARLEGLILDSLSPAS